MSEHLGLARRIWVFGMMVLVVMVTSGAQDVPRPADPAAAEEAREQRSMERFLSLLEKNPRRGTALDRVYGYHVERGTLDAFIKNYQDRITKNTNDGAGWLILGLLEGQRGQDAASVTALRQAETTRPEDPLPPYYLGQALVLVGQPEQAAAAFGTRALERKPTRNDILEIFQALGRVYQRTQKTDQALQVWNRLETLFPNDARVQEQIASALAEENQPAIALPRFEALAKRATDPFRQVQLTMQAADLKVRLGCSDQALRDFETMLAKLRPDSWLHREVRRKIEEVFLRNDDQPGLVAYYEAWTKKEPDDIEALVRLGRTRASMGRAAEALPWYEKAIKLAPTRRDLRLALISQLAGEQKFAEAALQYQAIDQADPNNPDTLRDWGALALRDTAKPAPERKAAAAAIWRKLLVAKPNDPVTTAQVADLLRQAELTDDALVLYKNAAELAPANPQYFEYIGEFLHNLKRPDEAKAAWARIADGKNKNPKNLARLAEVLAGFGYLKEAVPPLSEAVKLEADNFGNRLKLASFMHQLERYDDAEIELTATRKLAERDEEKDAVLEARVKNDLAANRVSQRIESLRKEIEADKSPTAEKWDILARYLEADGKLPEAVVAAEKAIQVEPRSIPAWTLAARVQESAGNLADAGDALRRLAEIDRRNRTEHLSGIAKIETRLGRTDAALKAGRDLLAAAPGNPEHYEFFAQLCFQLGKSEEGLDALRRAVRTNPNDTKIVLTLAETLTGQYQTEEAIEMYWRAFDRAEELDRKLDVVRRLTELYLQRNQLDRLLTRLQHADREERPSAGATQARERDVAMCLAQALATSGDLGGARSELDKLLAANNRDPQLLNQLSKLAEEEGDIESAARYQKQLIELAPSDDELSRLAQLYARSGELEEAQAVWSKMAWNKGGTSHVYQSIDNLLAHQKPQPVVELTEAMVRKDPRDWEALYREGVALAALQKPEEANKRFQALLALTVDDDDKSAGAKARARKGGPQANANPIAPAAPDSVIPLEQRIGMTYVMRFACNLDPRVTASTWVPDDFGQARMAALGWVLSLAQQQDEAKGEGTVATFKKAVDRTPTDVHALWDLFYLCQMRFDNAALYETARKLSQAAPTDPVALWAYLYAMGGRNLPMGQEFSFNQLRQTTSQEESAPPLTNDELAHVMDCYHSLRARRPELAQTQVLLNVSGELKRANRLDEEERFYREAVAGSTRLGQIAGAFVLAAQRGDPGSLIQLFERYDRLQTGRRALTYRTGSFAFNGPGLAMSQGMSVLADRKAYTDVLRLLDFNLLFARRKQEHQSPGAAARALRARYTALGYSGYVPIAYQIWVGPGFRRVQIPFPQVNEYFDHNVLQALRTAFELYKRDDLMSDLVQHFRRQADAASTPRDVIYPRLALSSILWWSDDREEAIAELTKVVDAVRAESELRLDLAELLEQERAYADALSLVDAVQPLDNMTLRRREELALRVAVSSGDVERARHAAERLFGLRLDTDTQVHLAGQMHQLGLHELAEAVLGRARRRAGNKTTALAGLMLQYQRQGKSPEAAQVALQILRSSSRDSQAIVRAAVADNPDAARASAIRVLAGSGRLPVLIERASEQLTKAPNSVQIHQTLADYYTAAREPDKAKAELLKLAELRPDDPNLRLQVADQLAREGDAAAALGHYKAAFKKDPILVGRSYAQIENTLLQNGKVVELLQLLDEVDLRMIGSIPSVVRLFQALPDDSSLSDRVRALYRKAWATFTGDHFYLIAQVRREDIWQMPEMYDYALEGIVPKGPTGSSIIPWYPFLPIIPVVIAPTNDPTNRIAQPAIARLLDLAASQRRLDELGGQIEAARKAVPDWTAGDFILAMVRCRAGAHDEAGKLVHKLLGPTLNSAGAPPAAYGLYASWALGLELEKQTATRGLAMTVYERSLGDPYALMLFRFQSDQLPIQRLVDLYASDGRSDDARVALLKLAGNKNFPQNMADTLIKRYRLDGLSGIARELVKLGFPGDAVPLFHEALALADDYDVRGVTPVALATADQSQRELRDGLNRAMNEITRNELAPFAARQIALAVDSATKNGDKAAPRPETTKPRDQAIDLGIMVHPQELDKATVRSLLAESLAACDADQSAALEEPLEAVRKAHPDDLSVAIAIALHALSAGDSRRIEPSLERLNELLERSRLEPLAPGSRANARQRTEAARQLPLWLVARACEQQSSATVRELGDRLRAQALEAARRQSEPRWALAMIREQGQLALEHHDRARAEAAWGRMLNMVLTPEQTKTLSPRVTRAANGPGPAKPTATRPTTAPAPARAKTSAPAPSATTGAAVPRLGLMKSDVAVVATPLTRPAGTLSPTGTRGINGRAFPRSEATEKTRRPRPDGERVGVRGQRRIRLARYQQPTAKDRPRTGAESPPDPAAAEEAREQRSMERFLSLLEKNPRRGTALDRVYGYHVERGTLDAFIKNYQDRVAKNTNDGAGWLILGLLEGQRGQDAASVTALRQAETTRPDDPLPPYYLGQALVLVGQPEQAAAAFERALERKPTRNDLLEIFQALGRVYQRTQKTDQALQVWNRLETLFPNDPRVQEQIASALAEENQPAVALPRFEALAKRATDPFRQVQLTMQAADLKVRLGRSDQALRDFETMLAKLRPDSWLHREVRRKIEEVFLRNDDQPGLVAYYQAWNKKEPEDIEALVRLGRTLAGMGRAAEALPWYEKAIKLAPTRRDLRLALISQLAGEQKFAEAALQYQAIDQADPNNPDTLRDWGALALRDTAKPAPERKAAAAAIWRKLLVAKPNDPVTTAQVADLLRQAELTDDALALYKKAAELAPANPQYYEYIGEFLHNLKRPDEARAAWAKIAEGANKNAKNLARLAEVLAGFGYVKEAVPSLSEAVKLEADNFDYHLKLADYLHRIERYDDAETELAATRKLALKDEEKDAVLEARVKNDLAANRVARRIDSIQKEIGNDKNPTAEKWRILARYLEADGKLPEAVRAAEKAIEVEPRSIPGWTLTARVRESAGNLADAGDALRRLAEIDRRNRGEHLMGIAKLEARLGRIDAALKAGRDLLAAAPGNPENYEFFAQLCFQLGRSEEGLDALRRAVRVNPNDTKITLTLAETLAGQYRTDEAIEMYWRAFDKAEDLDAKLSTVARLTDLYLQRNQLDRLLTRLQHQERDARPGGGQPQQRDVAICVAQAFASSGDLGSARAELERLLASNSRDTQLLQQLSKLSEEEGDIESAARYQKQLNELTPSDDGSSRLAQLYARYGELDLAQTVWSKMASGKSEAHRIFGAIDSLLGNKKDQPVMEITDSMLRKDPGNWEALYRQGVALADLNKGDIAAQRFQALLTLPLGDDDKSAATKARSRDPKLQIAGARPSAMARQTVLPIEDRIGQIYQIRAASQLENRDMILGRGGPAAVWAPADFGQARMAAIGWLVSLAQKTSIARRDQVVAQFRQAGEKTPADLRALWDSFYLALMQYDNANAFAVGKLLSRAAPADPLALWAYIYSAGARQTVLGQRNYVNQRTVQKDDTPPLEQAELDHLLACYNALRARRPELAQAQLLQTVDKELKRAKRDAQEEQFYRDSIAGATQLAQIAGAFGLAAERGDVDGLLQLSDRYERLQAGRTAQYYYTGTFYFASPSVSINQGMNICAQRKAHADVIRLLDHELAASRRKLERQTPGAARSARSRLSSTTIASRRYQISVGKGTRVVQIAFPIANEYLDDSAIMTLRTAYELYKNDDLTSDLVGHFRRQLEMAKGPTDAVYPRLALASLLWWNDEKEEAIAEFTKVAESSKAESELRLDLAELLEQQGQRADALALADSVQPLDNSTMKRREEIALRLSVLAGDLDRARQAGERLFGLRLDTDTQVRLAGQMQQLGQHELAEAVLGRARRRAGNKATALVGMMLQYQRQAKLDVAVQVAMQILRSTTAVRQTNPNIYYAEDPDASRVAAIGVLARSGRLPQLIERANDQLKKTPNVIQLHQALADYYKASGQRDKVKEELAKIVALRPDDSNLRYQIANQLVQDGQPVLAIEHFKAILKKDPAILGRNLYQIQNAFQQANQGEQFMNLLEQIDLRQFGQSYMVFNLIDNLFYNDKTRDGAFRLFKKAWESFPDDRQNMLTYVNYDGIWQLPEMYDYARECLIPKPATFAPAMQWNAFGQVISYGADGRVNSVVSRLLDLAAGQGKLENLGAQVDAARKDLPAWIAGNALKAMIDCRLGRPEQARSALAQFIDQTKDENLSTNIFWVMGAELENHEPTRDLAINLYRTGLERPSNEPYARFSLDNGPGGRLVALYRRDNRMEDARKVLLDTFSRADNSSMNVIYPDGYLEQIRMQGMGSAAAKLTEMGFTADAITLYSESLALARDIPADASNYIGNRQGLVTKYQSELTKALAEIQPADMTAAVARMLQQSEIHDSKNMEARKTADKGKEQNRDQFLDLMILVHPREIDKAAVRSLLADALASPSQAVATGASDDQRQQLAAALEAAAKKHPNDLSVAIAQALLALAGENDGRIMAALERLSSLVEKTPLEPLGDGARANARQRAEAARQVPLWLVARACWKRKVPSKEPALADKLAARAMEGARRQTENTTLMAMMREQGELALERGDRAAAQAAWGRMLELVIDPPESKAKKAAAKPVVPGAAPRPAAQPAVGAPPGRVGLVIPALRQATVRLASLQTLAPGQATREPAPAAQKGSEATKAALPRTKGAIARTRPGADAPRSNLPILTLDRFEQAMQIARLAAEHDLPDLSTRAVREALRAGPPVVPTSPNTVRRVIRSTGTLDEGPIDQASPRVIANLTELERLWQKHHLPPDAVYLALRDAVLPPGRPTEIFLYAQALTNSALRRPQSASSLLAAWAVRAGKTDDLKSAIAARQKQPLAELPAKVLSAQLALAGSDPAQAVTALQAIATRVKTDTSRTTSELVCQAALPALDRAEPELAKAALEIIDVSVKGFESSGRPEPLGTLLLVLARRQFQLGDAAGAGKRLEAYLEAQEKTTLRYGGDYPVYLRKQQLERVAAEFARAGAWTEALAALARFVDAPVYSGGDPPVDDVLVQVLNKLAASPAQERYKTLHDWTMPTKDRRIARILTSLSGRDIAPAVLSHDKSAPKAPADPTAAPDKDTELVSTATALIEAARQAGSLDQLAAEARAAAADQTAGSKVENAEVLYLLIELARGNGRRVAPRIEARVAELIKENETQTAAAAQPTGPSRGVRPGALLLARTDFVLACEALRNADPTVEALGMILASILEARVKKGYDLTALAQLRAELAKASARRAGAPKVLAEVRLADWHPATSRGGYGLRGGVTPAYWVAHDGHIAHLAGGALDYLLLDYPLTGTYEFSCEAYAGPWAESVLTHGGLAIEPFWVEGNAKVAPVGLSEQLYIPWRLTNLGNFNRFKIEASPKKVRYIVNGHLFYEDDDPSSTSPWLGLLTYRERHSVWRGLTLSGEPTIPREVKLSEGDRLEGWVSSFYNETQPPRRTDEITDQWGNVSYVARGGALVRRSGSSIKRTGKKTKAPINLDLYDWAAHDGVIHGRRVMPGSAPANVQFVDGVTAGTDDSQSVLSYFRPLRDGDVLTYEFLYEPGQVIAHPALGRVVFLLEPGGVKVHWMTASGSDLSGLAADNSVVEPANRRGPAQLPLKSGEWNAIKLTVMGDKATLELNGQAIYERPLEPAPGREFGLFHYKDQTSAQVRNVVLRGRWPEVLSKERMANLVAPAPNTHHSDADRRAIHNLIGESIFALEAGEIFEKARGLPPERAYELLSAWVLPAPDRPFLRLEGDFSTAFPAPELAGKNPAQRPGGGKPRLQSGGELRAPALALIEAARSLGKLDDLAARVEAVKLDENDDGATGERARLAMLGLIALARGDDEAAEQALESLRPLLGNLAPDAPTWQRWPEMCLVTRAISRPALRNQTEAVVDMILERVDKRKPTEEEIKTRPETWMRQARHLRAQLRRAEPGGTDAARPFGSDPEAARPWARVTQTRGETRGQGYPMPHWIEQDNQLTHYPGHDRDLMYMAVPLRGDFQLDCELTSAPEHVIRVAYGGLAVGPQGDLKSLDQSQFARPGPALPVNPPIEKLGEWYAFRLTKKGGRLAVSINGRKVHETSVAPESDPWVTVLSQGMETGTVRKLVISGDPQVPNKLNLSAMPDLAGWLPDDYVEGMVGDNPDWAKRGDEIVGKRAEVTPGVKQESLLKYHRPMLEDGEIAYEFYYEPGKVMVHPVVDRLAFLLDSDGVRIHRLTDGAFERTRLAPDNLTEEPENRRGPSSLPLRPNTWNRLVLKLAGDKVALELNEQMIFERILDPTNQRYFGLFHYADETQVRARNVTHQGNWPRSLPISLRPRE